MYLPLFSNHYRQPGMLQEINVREQLTLSTLRGPIYRARQGT